MAEIAGEMKNERAGGIGYPGGCLPRRAIVRICSDLTIESAQVTENHYANGIAENKKVLRHDAKESRRARECAIGTRPAVAAVAAVAEESGEPADAAAYQRGGEKLEPIRARFRYRRNPRTTCQRSQDHESPGAVSCSFLPTSRAFVRRSSWAAR